MIQPCKYIHSVLKPVLYLNREYANVNSHIPSTAP